MTRFRLCQLVLWLKSFFKSLADQSKNTKREKVTFYFALLSDFRYLRIIVGTSDEDTPKGARRRLVNYLAHVN